MFPPASLFPCQHHRHDPASLAVILARLDTQKPRKAGQSARRRPEPVHGAKKRHEATAGEQVQRWCGGQADRAGNGSELSAKARCCANLGEAPLFPPQRANERPALPGEQAGVLCRLPGAGLPVQKGNDHHPAVIQRGLPSGGSPAGWMWGVTGWARGLPPFPVCAGCCVHLHIVCFPWRRGHATGAAVVCTCHLTFLSPPCRVRSLSPSCQAGCTPSDASWYELSSAIDLPHLTHVAKARNPGLCMLVVAFARALCVLHNPYLRRTLINFIFLHVSPHCLPKQASRPPACLRRCCLRWVWSGQAVRPMFPSPPA